jgi:hypothetical protein
MADTDPTEEMVKREIAEAVRILRDDGVHISKTVGTLWEKMNAPKAEPPKEDPGEGDPPPKKEKPAEEPPKPEKRGLWWG